MSGTSVRGVVAALRRANIRHGKGKNYFNASTKPGSTTERGATGEVPNRGEVADAASSVLMKVLYGARMVRFDLLRAVCALARYVTKWDLDCDRKLHRLMCYIWTTKHHRTHGWVGESRYNRVGSRFVHRRGFRRLP